MLEVLRGRPTHVLHTPLGYHLAFAILPLFLLQPTVVMMATPASACWKHSQHCCVCLPQRLSLLFMSADVYLETAQTDVYTESMMQDIERAAPSYSPSLYYWSMVSWILICQFLLVLFRSFMAIPHPETQACVEGDGLEGSLSDRHYAALRLTLPLWPCSIVLQPTWCPSSLGMSSFPGRASVPHANSSMARPPCQSTLQTGLHGKILLKLEKWLLETI